MVIERRGVYDLEEVLNETTGKIDTVLREWGIGFVISKVQKIQAKSMLMVCWGKG